MELKLEVISDEVLKRNIYTTEKPYSVEEIPGSDTINMIGSSLLGTTFDINNNILSRTLKPSTKLVQIANEQMLKELGARVKQNAVQELLPDISFKNLFDGNKNTPFIARRKDWTITKRNVVATLLDKFLGVHVSEDIFPMKYANQKDLWNHTGKAQRLHHANNLMENFYGVINPDDLSTSGKKRKDTGSGYISHFTDGRDKNESSDYIGEINNFESETGNENKIPGVTPNDIRSTISTGKANEELISKGSFGTINKEDGEIILSGSPQDIDSKLDLLGARRGILYYTAQLAKTDTDIGRSLRQDTTEYGDKINVKYKGTKSRSFTLVKPYGVKETLLQWEGNGNPDSVIGKTVMPRISALDQKLSGGDQKKYMFSIENLAYDIPDMDMFNISQEERGKNGGRIMWFAPYGLEFDETATAKYESTQIIGRNEPFYTFHGSERYGSLSFILLIDHSKVFKGKSRQEIESYLKAEVGPSVTVIEREEDKIAEELKIANNPISNEPLPEGETQPAGIQNDFAEQELMVECYFDHQQSGVDSGSGEYGVAGSGYNAGFLDQINKLNDVLASDNIKITSAKILSGASAVGTKEYNFTIASQRANNLLSYVEMQITSDAYNKNWPDVRDNIQNHVEVYGEAEASSVGNLISNKDNPEVVADRYAKIIISYQKGTEETTVKEEKYVTPDGVVDNSSGNGGVQTTEEFQLNTDRSISKPVYSADQGAGLEKSGLEVFEGGHYKPAFHSQTAEDFINRLTFLQQCTRQGRGISVGDLNEYGTYTEGSGENSVFGRMPVCVLRVGDFYNTKALIEQVNFTYAVGNDITWDMNQDGYGMQPMYCRVTMTVRLLGGQSLSGPINKLQNATSFNYYANSTFKNAIHPAGGIHENAIKDESAQYYRAGRLPKLEKKGYQKS